MFDRIGQGLALVAFVGFAWMVGLYLDGQFKVFGLEEVVLFAKEEQALFDIIIDRQLQVVEIFSVVVHWACVFVCPF